MRDNGGDLRRRQPEEGDGSPKFGRLLVVLALALVLIVAITFASEAYFS